MRVHGRRFTALLPAALITFACAEPSVLTPGAAGQASLGGAAVLPFDVFGLHTPGLPGARCAAPPYRQFDFWVGEWEVFDPTGTSFLGINIVKSELGGCAVGENWTGAGGSPGRSINFYDASIDRWTQMWVAAGGGLGGVLLLEGGIVDGSMQLSGRRVFADFGGFTVADTITWTLHPDGTVQQFWLTTPNVGIFDGRYRSRPGVTPPEEVITPTCGARPSNRELDFLLGTWTLRPGDSRSDDGGAVTSIVATDLSDCLIEERITGPDAYEGWSFAAWSAIDHRWHRTYVDNAGRRLVLHGGMEFGAMVMSGPHRSASGVTIDVRITWRPLDDGDVEQRWEVSRDGGATWQFDRTVRYVASRSVRD